jgi:separase
LPSLQRIQTRVRRLEKAAMASHVFALIQYSIVSLLLVSRLSFDFLSCVKDEVPTAFDGLLQSLRLWNRAVESTTSVTFSVPRRCKSVSDDKPEGSSTNGNIHDSHQRAASSQEDLPPAAIDGRTGMASIRRIARNLIFFESGIPQPRIRS